MNYISLLHQAFDFVLKDDSEIVILGLGVTDPRAIFTSYAGFVEKYGTNRIIEIPTSENAITGVSLGLVLAGKKVILTHQRQDFTLLSFDQIANSISKWNSMFSTNTRIPLLIRVITGRGWGQGPTHQQNFQTFFSRLPGFSVISPVRPIDAANAVVHSMYSSTPTVLIEHRWLHGINVNDSQHIDYDSFKYNAPPNTVQLAAGRDITVVSSGIASIDTVNVLRVFESEHNVTADHFSIQNLSELDLNSIEKSILKTKTLIVVDNDIGFCGINSQIIAMLANILSGVRIMNISQDKITLPTSRFLLAGKEINSYSIYKKICSFVDVEAKSESLPYFQDTPGDWFEGPF